MVPLRSPQGRHRLEGLDVADRLPRSPLSNHSDPEAPRTPIRALEGDTTLQVDDGGRCAWAQSVAGGAGHGPGLSGHRRTVPRNQTNMTVDTYVRQCLH